MTYSPYWILPSILMTVRCERCVTNKAVTVYCNWQLTSTLTGLSTTSWKWTVTSPRSYWWTLKGTSLPFPVSIYRSPTYSVSAAPSSWVSLFHRTCRGRSMWTVYTTMQLGISTFSPCWRGLGWDLTVWQRYTTIVRFVLEHACQVRHTGLTDISQKP